MSEKPTYEELEKRNRELEKWLRIASPAESQKHYRNILDCCPSVVYTKDLEGRYTSINKQFEELSGLKRDDIIGKTDFELFTPPVAKNSTKNDKQVIQTGVPIDIEEFGPVDGKMHTFSSTKYPLFDEVGNIYGICGISSDITEQKTAEDSLRKSRMQSDILSSILVNTPLTLVYYKINKDIIELLDWNTASENVFGWTKEEVIGKNFFDFLPADSDIPMVHDVYLALKKDRSPQNLVNRCNTKSGGEVLISWFNNSFYEEESETIYVVSLGLDITKQNKAELALKNSEERFSLAMEASKDGLWDWDLATGDIYCSPGLTSMLGYDSSDVIKSVDEWQKLIHPEDRQKAYQANIDCVNNLTDSFAVEYRIKTKDGGFKWILGRGKAAGRDATGKAVRMIGTHQDITEKLKLQAQLSQAQKMEAIGNLAGGIAHDFNNILSSIIGFTELALDDTQEGTPLEDSLQEVYSAGKRAKELVQQILAFARQSDEKRSPIRPKAIVNEVLHFMRSTIPTTIEIRQSIESDSWIMGNTTQIHQVFMNLCTNAAQAMEESGGVLDVGLKDVIIDKKDLSIGIKPGEYLEAKVSDTGVGISPEIIGSVFEPYFTTKGVGEGTGMGLAMVQGVVESYGGKITVDSQLGKGTTFTIHVPITKKQSAVDTYVAEKLPTGTERILFVDDEAPIAKMGSQILERLGYSVTTRTSSVEALELFQTKPDDFDLIVTDMTMPNMTGDKLAIELMKIRSGIPVILCTGYSKKISDETASEIGIKAFAYKPVVKADLAKTVRKVLDDAKS